MDINNFEEYIDNTIIDRGYDYYINGNIIGTYKQDDNEYLFKINGTDDYEVIVNINEDGEIIYSNCDCPYDFGPVCKHEVASYYKLQNILNNKDEKSKVEKNSTKGSRIEDVLNELSKEKLVNIILDIAKKDKIFKNKIILKYSKGESSQELKKCKKLIDSIVKKYTGREGFIRYGQTYEFALEMETILEKAMEEENEILALDICFLILEEGIKAFQYADDSDGNIGVIVRGTVLQIEDKLIHLNNADIKLRENIFNKLIEQSDSEVFNGWDEYRIDILRMCIQFADIENLKNKLKEKINCFIDKDKKDFHSRYANESMLEIIYYIIEKYESKEKAMYFAKENIDFTCFRELLINMNIEEKNYNYVIELALEGEKKDKDYAGLVLKWKKIRYICYKGLGLKKEQEKLARELLFGGNFEYYDELKELSKKNNDDFYNDLKEELKNRKDWYSQSIYVNMIVKENDVDEILSYVKENPRNIESYEKLLLPRFKDQVIKIYEEFIKLVASESSNRKQYKNVCRIINKYKRIAGNENKTVIVDELSSLYKRRPAFLDELSKIKK